MSETRKTEAAMRPVAWLVMDGDKVWFSTHEHATALLFEEDYGCEIIPLVPAIPSTEPVTGDAA